MWREKIKWTDVSYEVVLTYNKIKHSATAGSTPSDVKKNSNETDLKLNLLNKQKHDQKYSLLSMGGKESFDKKNDTGEKLQVLRDPWSKTAAFTRPLM